MTVAGKHCEQGDIVVRDAHLPADLAVGDVLATPVTGALRLLDGVQLQQGHAAAGRVRARRRRARRRPARDRRRPGSARRRRLGSISDIASSRPSPAGVRPGGGAMSSPAETPPAAIAVGAARRLRPRPGVGAGLEQAADRRAAARGRLGARAAARLPRTPRRRTHAVSPLWAAVLWAGPGCALSHRSAAHAVAARAVATTGVAGARRPGPACAARRWRSSCTAYAASTAADVGASRGCRSRRPLRTIIDLAAWSTIDELGVALESARLRGPRRGARRCSRASTRSVRPGGRARRASGGSSPRSAARDRGARSRWRSPGCCATASRSGAGPRRAVPARLRLAGSDGRARVRRPDRARPAPDPRVDRARRAALAAQGWR